MPKRSNIINTTIVCLLTFVNLHTKIYYISATEWNCASSSNSGTFTRSSDCTISGNAYVDVSGTLKIVGSNENIDNLVTIIAANNKRHFYLNHINSILILTNIKLDGADISSNGESWDSWGGAICIGANGGELNLYSSLVTNNKAYFGGGIFVYDTTNTNIKNVIMNIYNSIITNNEATKHGGSIYMKHAVGTITNTTIDNNEAVEYGGGMFIESSDLTLNNTIISNNNATGVNYNRGGGLYIKGDDCTINIRQSSFINNDANDNGGDIYTDESPNISLINTYFHTFDIYESSNGSPTWKTCSDNLCTENPFTGTCNAVDNTNSILGVLCNYNVNSCSAGALPLPVSVAISAPITTATCQWSCTSSSNTGTFKRYANCTISGNNHVAVSNTLEIVGSNEDMNNLITITAATNKRHFYLNHANSTLILRYLKLVGGDVSSYSDSHARRGGSIYIQDNGGELNLYSSIVFNNKAKYGGGIYVYGASNTNKNAIMNIYNSIIHNNEATQHGGGIYMLYAVATIDNTTIDYNQASSGSGGGMSISSSDVTMKNTIISNNDAGGYGAGLSITGDSTVTLRQSSFINNDATNDGDEIYTGNSPTISLINTYFNNPNNNNNIYDRNTPTWKTCSNNLCTENPFNGTCSAVDNTNIKLGVLCNYNTTVLESAMCSHTESAADVSVESSVPGITPSCFTLPEWDCASSTGKFKRSTDCTISGGDHISVSNTPLEIIGKNTDMNNLITITAATDKRHFYLNNANAKLILRYLKLVGGDVSSYSDSHARRGGSIYIQDNGGELNLYSSIVFNNKAKYGGGIYPRGDSSTNRNAIMNIYNSIIHNNEGTSMGGGIYMSSAVATIYNTTIDTNQASSQYGGGMYIVNSDATMKNTIISNAYDVTRSVHISFS